MLIRDILKHLPSGVKRPLRRSAVETAHRLEGLAAAIRDWSRYEMFEDQIGGSGSKLEHIARQAAKPGMMALEIGSWAGASTAIIGKVVKEHGGRLYCVDWWKGNLAPHDGVVDLAAVAREINVFEVFETNMRRQGLDDVVHPLKMSSDSASSILKDDCFDFIFIDGEHVYTQIKADIVNYFPKVKVGGILSGHDCEGRLDEFDIDYIDAHKDIDFERERGLHCGVIKAVGESFDRYHVEDTIWYLAKEADTVCIR